jgi:hypothetical protein
MSKTHTLPATTPIATALQAAGITVTHGTTYADPIDLLEDYTAVHPQLYGRTMSSVAWRIDTMCIQAARTLLFARYSDPERDNREGFANFCLTVGSELQHASLYEQEGPEQTLAQLMAVSNHYHDAAANAAALADKDYRAKSFRELLDAEHAKPVNSLEDVPPSLQSRTNYATLAKTEARGDEAAEARIYAAYCEADSAQAFNRLQKNKELVNPLLEVLRAASMFAEEDTRFDQLPYSNQRTLAQYCLTALIRVRGDLAKSTTPIAFGHLAECTFKCAGALEALIKAKFSDRDQMENNTLSQVELDHQRGQKRMARAIG